MTKEKLKQYRALKRELAQIDDSIEKLRQRAEDVPEVVGKVTSSGKEFPYIKGHVSVQMSKPKEMDEIKKRVQIRKKRQREVTELIEEIEQFIAAIPDSTDRQIFELTFIEGKRQREVADIVGYTQSRISQIIRKCTQD